jgi:hypothetical protein
LYTEAALRHFLISAWPSANENPQAPLWYDAGISCQYHALPLLPKQE